MRRRIGERMISACVIPTVKHEGGGVMVWGCIAGDTVCDLFRIQGTLNQHGYHSILQQYAIPSGLRLVELSFVFQQDNDSTHLQCCVRAIWPRRRLMECCNRWPGIHNHTTSTQFRWFRMSWTTEGKKSSQQVLSICGNSLSTMLENHSRWSWLRKSVQSCHQYKGWLL